MRRLHQIEITVARQSVNCERLLSSRFKFTIEPQITKLKKYHRSDVQLFERLASLGNHVCPIDNIS